MFDSQGIKRVVIVGGGFGGIAVAKRLAKNRDVEVIVVTKDPFFEYYPALYKIVTGALAIEVCVPYNKIFSKDDSVSVVEGFYQSFDSQSKLVKLLDGREFSYDYLVLAMGSQTNFFGIPGVEEFAFAFKSSQEALRLKQHFIDLLQASKDITKDELVKRFHVTVVGGGPSGVELAGDITTYLRRMTKRYHIDPSFVTVDLIESNPRVLAMLPESVSKKAEARLRKLKVNLYTNRTLQSQDLDTMTASGITMRSGTVIWTAGTKVNEAFNSFPLDPKKRVIVKSDLSLESDPDVFVVGDGASVAGTGLAQGAVAHGKYVGEVIVSKLNGKNVLPFKYKSKGYLIPIGHNWAIFSYKNICWSGFIPWIMRSFADFEYFLGIVSFTYAIQVFKQGKKYRQGKC